MARKPKKLKPRNEIRELFNKIDSNDKDTSEEAYETVISDIKTLTHRLNQRLYKLEQTGLAKSSTTYQYAQKETGSKDKPRYTENVNKFRLMDTEELKETYLNIQSKLEYRSSTVTGVKGQQKELLEAQLEKINPYLKKNDLPELTEEEWNDALNKGMGELLNNKYLDSYQIIEDFVNARRDGVTVKEFAWAYNRIKKKEDVDYYERGRINVMRNRERAIKRRKK